MCGYVDAIGSRTKKQDRPNDYIVCIKYRSVCVVQYLIAVCESVCVNTFPIHTCSRAFCAYSGGVFPWSQEWERVDFVIYVGLGYLNQS